MRRKQIHSCRKHIRNGLESTAERASQTGITFEESRSIPYQSLLMTWKYVTPPTFRTEVLGFATEKIVQ
jgi:hypothetical protein